MRKRYAFLGIAVLLLIGIIFFMLRGKTITPSSHLDSVSSSSRSYYQPDWSRYFGALVEVKLRSTVGVVLDEIPEREREKLANDLLLKSVDFWTERAKRQIRLTSLRLSFRNSFYPKGTKWQLPLPPEEHWKIELLRPPKREMIDGHDVVTAHYEFSGMLLTDAESPGIAEPKLKEVGGMWNEQFILPVDPEFIFQRTGFACFNESQFPPNSVDAEEADLFYDHGCKVESRLSNTGCHQTVLPKLSCIDALKAEIGRVETTMQFKRLPWDAEVAADVRTGHITNPTGPDLEPYAEAFRQHRFTYRYIPKNSCTLEEQCVGAPGWRRLLMFPTADLNSGAKALDIGLVDYFHTMNGTKLSEHGMFELSECHGHYHFSHYGTFSLGEGSDALTRKNGFCMQPTARLSNHELSPLHHPYVDCLEQGVAVGWIDEYKMGLECQWIDVTSIRPNQELPLSFVTNPDGLLCEGNLKRDARGKVVYEPTTFTTSTGKPVNKPQCELYEEWLSNNTESYDVQIPGEGESYVTEQCREGLFGELRNCGLENKKEMFECQPGKKVTLHCRIPAGSPLQVFRLCEASRALKTGIPCTYNDALASGIIKNEQDITFTCPIGRDEVETGGAYSFLSGPLFVEEERVEVKCEVKE